MQQITRGDYLKDLITIYIDNNLQTSLTDLYNEFVFQCGDIQKFLTPAQVIKISFNEQESQLLKSSNTCYLAGITKDGHKETFNGSLPAFLAAFTGRKRLSPKDVEELKRFVKEYEVE